MLKSLKSFTGSSDGSPPPLQGAFRDGAGKHLRGSGTGSGVFDFQSVPIEGTLLKIDEQVYELRETYPHHRNDGSPTTMLVWETACPSCGDDFTLKTGMKVNSINRRCPKCSNAAKPVKGKRGRKLKVEVIAP